MTTSCKVCGHRYEAFEMLRLIGFLAGFDGEDHPVLVQMRNCPKCAATFGEVVDYDFVAGSVTVPGKIGQSAAQALEDLEMHVREANGDASVG